MVKITLFYYPFLYKVISIHGLIEPNYLTDPALCLPDK